MFTRDDRSICLSITLIVTLIMIALALTTANAKRRYESHGATTYVDAIYSMDKCPSCRALEQYLTVRRVNLHVVGAKGRRIVEYPTVKYTDGTTDTGTKIYEGKARYMDNLTLFLVKM